MRLLTRNRCKERALRTPPIPKPTVSSVDPNSKMPSETGYAACYSVYGEVPVASKVGLLLKWCLPRTIIRIIATVIINPAKRAALGSFSHIFQKIPEIGPSLANGDPPRSINRELRIVGVCASLNHVVPTGISWGLGRFGGVTVFFRHSIGSFNVVFNGRHRFQPVPATF